MGAPHPLLLSLLRGDDLPSDSKVSTSVVASAEEHFVAALVGEAVRGADVAIPRDLASRLAADAMASQAENAAAASGVAELLAVADDLGAQVAIFKGVAIGQRFYEDPALRPAVDVDAFIAPGSLHAMGDLVRALGGSQDDADAVAAMATTGRVFEISLPFGDTLVDIHRDPMNMLVPAVDEDERWDRTVAIELPDGTTFRTLDLEDTVTQALLHLFRDNFADLLHINDVRLMIGAAPDWDEVERRAALDGWAALVRYAMWFVCDVLDQPSPLPTTLPRWKKAAIESIWRRDLLLQGTASHALSLRRQSAAGLLVSNQPTATALAYGHRLLPPRSVINQRSGSSGGPYPVALARWRMAQRTESAALRRAATVTPDEAIGHGDGQTARR